MRIIDFFKEKFHPHIIEEFNDLIENHSKAVRYFCSAKYLEPNLNRRDKSTHEIPTKKSRFSTKAYFVDEKESIISNFEIEENYINEQLDELIQNHNDALVLYCNAEYTDPYIRKKKGHKSPIPTLNSPFYEKRSFVSSKSVILKYYDYEKEYIKDQSLLIFYRNWEKSQAEFAKICRELRDEVLPNWGCYHYEIPLFKTNSFGKTIKGNFKVWQLFYGSFAPQDNLDYTYFKQRVENRELNDEFLNRERYYVNRVYDQIYSFIIKLKEHFKDDGSILDVKFGDSSAENYETLNDYHFNYLVEQLRSSNIINKRVDITPDKNIISVHRDRIVIVDLITTNDRLKSICKAYIESLTNCANNFCSKHERRKECFINIVYISLRKEYSKEEMQELIDARNAQIIKEKRAKETLDKANAIAYNNPNGFRFYFHNIKNGDFDVSIAEQINDKESDIIGYEQATKQIKKAVSGWQTHSIGFPYYFFYYYYPKRFKNVTSTSDKARKIIWNFKDGITILGLEEMISQKLQKTFGSHLKYLTLVCIPASTIQTNKERYERFARGLCLRTGMRNAFPHVHIVQEKSQSHLGGTDSAEFSFDNEFFIGANIILFDDVVTRGRSMHRFNSLLSGLGANVVCAMSIGRTYSDYYGDNHKPHPYTDTL